MCCLLSVLTFCWLSNVELVFIWSGWLGGFKTQKFCRKQTFYRVGLRNRLRVSLSFVGVNACHSHSKYFKIGWFREFENCFIQILRQSHPFVNWAHCPIFFIRSFAIIVFYGLSSLRENFIRKLHFRSIFPVNINFRSFKFQNCFWIFLASGRP